MESTTAVRPRPPGRPGRRTAVPVRLVVPLVLTAALALVVVTAAHDVLPTAALQLLVVSAGVLALRRRAADGGEEGPVWRWFARAALAVWAGTLVGLVLALAEATGHGRDLDGVVGADWPDLATSAGSSVACVLLYQGLIVWNRVSTKIADPGDWLNGISAAFAVAALVHLLLAWTTPDWPLTSWWALQLSVARFSALFIVLGTTLTVAVLAGLLRDLRPWTVGGSALALMGLEVVTTTAGLSPGWSSTCWALFTVVLAWAAWARPHPVRPQAATTQSLTIGTFVVLLASVTVILLSTRLPPALTWGSSVCAGLSVVGVSTRVVRLIADLATLAQTRQEAMTDDLTGLANRRAFTLELQRSTPTADGVAVLLLDLDRFKEVNDRFGHDAGDQLLRRTAERLTGALPPGALLARLGGDEFAVLLRTGDDDLALGVAAALARAGAGAGSGAVDGTGHVTASVGVATSRSTATGDGGELLRQADVAMYVAKGSRNAVSLYDDALDQAGRHTALLSEEIADVLDSDSADTQLLLHYQPQVDLRTGTVVGVEALVRWQHPRLGLLLPGDFLDVVERTGRMGALTTVVLTQAARQSQVWRDDGIHLRTAVNLSAASLSDPDLQVTLDHLVRHGMVAATTVLEITETVLTEDPLRAVDTLQQLRDKGFDISIDDYGTGYSSLSYLADLPATEVKLDRSFTRRLLTEPRVRHIVAGTVELAHRLGLRVVAEGVEDEETLRELWTLGVDETQGYLHSRPLAAGVLTAWLDRGRVSTGPGQHLLAGADQTFPRSSRRK